MPEAARSGETGIRGSKTRDSKTGFGAATCRVDNSQARNRPRPPSKRERKRLKRETERREIERRVERMIVAGESSGMKIFENILTQPSTRRSAMSPPTRGP